MHPPPLVSDAADDGERFRATVRKELEQLVLPCAERWEAKGRISDEGWVNFAKLGVLSMSLTGPKFLQSAIVLEEIGRLGFAGVRASIGVHAFMAPCYLEMFGTDRQKHTYLSSVQSAEKIAALAITEPSGGSDLSGLSTLAVADGAGYRVSGCKSYVTNGSRADFFVVLVKTGERASTRALSGASLMIIDARSAGLSRTPVAMLGWRSADVCTVHLANVWVPGNNLIGRQGVALKYLMRALDFERLVAGLLALGGADRTITELYRYTSCRRIKNRPLSDHQVIRHRLADLSSELELLRQYGRWAAVMHSQQSLDTRSASILKLKASELAVSAAQACAQYQGAQGYMSEATAARYYRDAIAGTIAAGSSESLRELIFETCHAAR